jgi:hypothetical protein
MFVSLLEDHSLRSDDGLKKIHIPLGKTESPKFILRGRSDELLLS